MNRNWMKYVVRAPEGDEGGSNGGAAVADTTAADTTTTTQAASTTATAGAGATTTTAAAATTTTAAAATTSKGTEGGFWPDDWRANIAKGDEKAAARLARYANPEALATALFAAQHKISSGELAPVLSKDASAEELKAWRADRGIPESPDKYNLDFGKGMQISEGDQPLVDEFLKAAHSTNQTPDQVKASIKAYYDVNAQITERRNESDRQTQLATEETLRAEWGPEFKRDINLIHSLLDKTTTPELKDAFLGGRLADGTPIGSSPDALKFLLGLALVDNPAGTVVPNTGGNIMQSVSDEMEKIEKVMRNNRAAYSKDETMQQRYRELINAKLQMEKRK